MKSTTELPLVGGDLALDFVNTAQGRGGPMAEDALRTEADLRAWGVRVDLVEQRAATDDASELAPSVAARELLYALFSARAHGRPLQPELLARLGELAAEAYVAGSLKMVPEGRLAWSWDPSALSSIRHAALISAVELLAGAQTRRLKQCPGDDCGWFFLDTTKRGNRRWCSMSECGQEAKNLRRRKPASGLAVADRRTAE